MPVLGSSAHRNVVDWSWGTLKESWALASHCTEADNHSPMELHAQALFLLLIQRRVWMFTLEIPALESPKQIDCYKLEASLAYLPWWLHTSWGCILKILSIKQHKTKIKRQGLRSPRTVMLL